jgi:transcriptional regulator with XRE-family HTH domain
MDRNGHSQRIPRARALAAALKQARLDRNLSGRELANRLKLDQSYVSRIENGTRLPSVETTARILGALHAPSAECERILELARRVDEPNWLTVGIPGIPQQLAAVVESERAATEITEWSPMILPGLLQTAEYARAVAAANELEKHEIESRVMVKLSRREVLAKRKPVQYEVLIGEGVLLEPFAPSEVMIEQLRYLLSMSEKRNIELRVVPRGAGWHPGTAGPFILYQFPDASPVLYFEHYSSGAFVPDEDEIKAYRKAVRMIRDVGLSASDSMKLIAQILVNNWS